MATLGAHPRLAAMMLAARTPAERAMAADIAALLEERDPLRPRRPAGGGRGAPPTAPADIRLRLDLLAGGDHPDADRAALSRIRHAARQYRRRLGLGRDIPASGDPAALIAAAFPDRVAQSRGDAGSFRMAGGGSARLSKTDELARCALLAVAGMHVRKAAEICLAAPLDRDALPDSLLARAREQVETTLDTTTGNVLARRRLRLGNLVLRDRTVSASADEVCALLCAQAAQNPAATFTWSDACRQLQARVELARNAWTARICPTCRMRPWPEPPKAGLPRGLRGEPPVRAGGNGPAGHAARDDGPRHAEMAGPHVAHPSGHAGGRAAIDYLQPVPVASARAQTFYGVTQTPALPTGRSTCVSPCCRPRAGRRPLPPTLQGSGPGHGRICAVTCADAIPAMTGPKTPPQPRPHRPGRVARHKNRMHLRP